MEPTPVKPWYKKARYLVPIGTLVALWMVGSTGSSPAAVTTSVSAVTQAASVAGAAAVLDAAPAVTNTVQLQQAAQASPAVVAQPQPTYTPPSQPATQAQVPTSSGLSNDTYYTNSSGNEVHSPAYTNDNSIPAGASAQCRDGTYSFSQHRSGTCSHHGGVATWY